MLLKTYHGGFLTMLKKNNDEIKSTTLKIYVRTLFANKESIFYYFYLEKYVL